MPNAQLTGMTAFWIVLLGGPLADFVMEPAMRPGGALVGLLLSLSLWFVPMVRNVEDLFPDHRATQGLSAP